MKKLWNKAFGYLLAATVVEVALAGILEATGAKAVGTGIVARPMGLIVHTHLLALGFFVYVLLIMLEKLFGVTADKGFARFEAVYNSGLIVSAVIMIYRSMGEIFMYEPSKMLAMGVGTLGHILMTVGLIQFCLILKRRAVDKN